MRHGGSVIGRAAAVVSALVPLAAAVLVTPAAAGTICAVARDQRGVHRPQGPGCEIGAYESKA